MTKYKPATKITGNVNIDDQLTDLNRLARLASNAAALQRIQIELGIRLRVRRAARAARPRNLPGSEEDQLAHAQRIGAQIAQEAAGDAQRR